MASAILTNSILFGIVRDRHCKSKDKPDVIPIQNGPEFREAIQETIEFLFSTPGQVFFPSQDTWTSTRARYLCTQFLANMPFLVGQAVCA